MIKVTAIKNNESFYGSIPKIANKINVHPVTIHRWIDNKLEVVHKNGFSIYLKTEEL